MSAKRVKRLGVIKAEAETKEYKDLFEPQRIDLEEDVYLVVSASSLNGDTPHVDVRTYIETEKYSGPTKKGINFEITKLKKLIVELDKIRQNYINKLDEDELEEFEELEEE